MKTRSTGRKPAAARAAGSTRAQLLLTHLLVGVCPLLGFAVLLSVTLPRRYTQDAAARLRAELALTRAILSDRTQLGAPPFPVERRVRELAEQTGLRITVIDRSGRVLAESNRDPRELENHASRPEFQQALATGKGQAVRHSKTLGIDMLYVAAPLAKQGPVLRLATPLHQLRAARGALRSFLIGSALAAGILGLLLAAALGRRVSEPLEELRSRVDRFAGGDLGARVRPRGSLETRRLGESFNEMAARLREMIAREAEDRSRYQTIFTEMADGIVVTDAAGRVALFNPAARQLLGVPPDTSFGRSLLEVTLHPGLSELLQSSMRSGGTETAEVRLSAGGGRVLRAHAAPVTGAAGELAGAVVVLQDLTEARRLEEMRRDFVANVSHELKSPVAGIRALAETLVLRVNGRPEIGKDYAARIAAEAERLSQLLADLLDLAAIESGRKEYHPEPVAATHVLERVTRRYAEAASRRETTLDWSAPADVSAWADGRSIEQALSNLVDNAIRYGGPGAKVSLRAAAAGGEVVFSVCDSGPGIPPAAVPRLFERFYRVDPGRSREEGGTGLGLAIAKHLVESQRGRIWVESEPGRGSSFFFAVPVAPEGADADLSDH